MNKDKNVDENDVKQVDDEVEISPRTGKPINKAFSPKKRRKNNSWLSPQNYLQNL